MYNNKIIGSCFLVKKKKMEKINEKTGVDAHVHQR